MVTFFVVFVVISVIVIVVVVYREFAGIHSQSRAGEVVPAV